MTRILIVDDHEIVRRGLIHLLEEALPQAVFGEANDLAAARASLPQQPWDLVLLDINLPDGNGLDLIADLRRDGNLAQVLVLSTYPEAEFAIRAFKLGAAGYLTKGSVVDEMVAAITRIIAGGKYVTATLAELLATELGQQALPAPHETLSPRELEVLKLIASGRTIKEIASAFALSEKTIATYRSRLGEKLGKSSNVELTRYAFQHKLID
jgi:DNA-binding NarL/FixJ family response regulator